MLKITYLIELQHEDGITTVEKKSPRDTLFYLKEAYQLGKYYEYKNIVVTKIIDLFGIISKEVAFDRNKNFADDELAEQAFLITMEAKQNGKLD